MQHKDCKNYANEWCFFKNVRVEPDGESCEFFEQG